MRQLIGRELRRAHRRIQATRVDAGDCDFRYGGGAGRSLYHGQQSGEAPAQRHTGPAHWMGWCQHPRCASWRRSWRRCLCRRVRLCRASGRGARRLLWPGAQVFAELLEGFSLKGFRYSSLGLRDGILAQMLAEQDARAAAHSEFEHERWESVLATARRYGVDPKHAEPVRAHVLQLFRELKSLHDLPLEYEGWLARRRCCAIRASSSTTRDITGTRNILFRARRCMGLRRCSGRWCRHWRAIWERAGRSRAIARCAIFLPRAWQCASGGAAAAAGGGAEPGPCERCAAGVGAGISEARVSEVQPGRTGAELELWSLRKRPITSARSLGGSSLRRWRRSAGRCAGQ